MKRQTFNEINITPLTDIFLVLLIIMMVIAPMLDQQGLNLAIPEYVEKQAVQKESKLVTVSITADNKYFIDTVEVSEKDLYKTIKERAKVSPDGLIIQAQGDSYHQSVVKVMDEARNAGVTSISLTQM